jgi:hypothetical protein
MFYIYCSRTHDGIISQSDATNDERFVLWTVFSSGDTGRTLLNNVSEICGCNFCPGNEANENSNMQRPPDEQIYTVAGIYLACMVSACIIVAVGVDSLKR